MIKQIYITCGIIPLIFLSCKTNSIDYTEIPDNRLASSDIEMAENENNDLETRDLLSAPAENNVVFPKDIYPTTESMLIQKSNQESETARSPIADIKTANKESLQEPNKYTIQNSLVVYTYNENFIYRVYTSPQRVTVLRMAEGEKIIGDLVSGDTANWIIANGEDKSRDLIYIKPIRHGINTNLIINTSERTYHLIVMSLQETYMVSVEWYYPLEHLTKKEVQKTILEIPVSLEDLYFGYKIIPIRKDPVWMPIKIFDDGTRTFIQFRNKLDIAETPVLFSADKKGKSVLVNYRVIDDYYVVDKILYNAELRVGNKKRDVIKIVRLKRN